MPLTLYIATTNSGKLRDFAAAAEAHAGKVEFAALPGLGNISAPPENALTFEGNACDKAAFYSLRVADCVVLADDSGLEVDALGGGPGVRSARYAADGGFVPKMVRSDSVDERNNLFLLRNLHGIPIDQRTGRYRCVLAAAQGGECIAIAEGSVEGTILESPRGSGGFGYDPLFYIAELDRTMAEIGLEEKLRISHRGQALRGLLAKLSF